VSGGGSDPGGIVLRRWQSEALPIVISAIKARKNPVVSAFMGAGKSVFLAALIRQSREMPGRGVVVAAPRANLVRQLAATLRRVLGAESVGCWYEAEKEGGRRVTVSTYQSLPTLCAAWQAAGRSASLLVCDEVHGTEAEAVQGAIRALDTLSGRAVPRVGLTATPFRSVARETLSLWDEVVYRYGWREGIADRVIVPWRVIRWDGREHEASDVDAICLDMLRRADVWPTLASARSIDDADGFASYLTSNGIAAAAVHSGISTKEQARRIDALRDGELKVLVHVAMLAEGADFPWLRGLMLRRKVSARVRFVQEVGRVLRAHPGKSEGVIFDPFDLMTGLGMTHDDSIGEAMEEDEGLGATEDTNNGDKMTARARGHEAVACLPLSTWLASTLLAASSYGARRVANGRWRADPATPNQMAQIRRYDWAWRWWRGDPRSRERIRKWVTEGRAFTKGEAADLIMLLVWILQWSESYRSDMSRGVEVWLVQQEYSSDWPPGLPPELPALEDVREGA